MKIPFRAWVLIIALILAVVAISPNPWAEGIEVQSVTSGSDADEFGLSAGDILYAINDHEIATLEDFYDAVEEMEMSTMEHDASEGVITQEEIEALEEAAEKGEDEKNK